MVDGDGDHSVLALFKGSGGYVEPRPDGGLGIGRYFRPDELGADRAPGVTSAASRPSGAPGRTV